MTNNDDFDAKLRETQERAATAAEQGFGALTKSLQDVIALQTSEIARLRDIIEDGSTIPDRHPVNASLGARDMGGRIRHDVLAIGNDHTIWLMIDAPIHPDGVKYHPGWIRLPSLPQAADEMNAAQPRRKVASDE